MRSYKIVVLALLCALLSGCTQARQVESIAFAVILGADLTEEEGIELTVQIPKSAALRRARRVRAANLRTISSLPRVERRSQTR